MKKNTFENLSRQSLAWHSSSQSLLPFVSTWALAVSQWAQGGAGHIAVSADPTFQRLTASFLQRLLAVVPNSSQRCPAILSLNRGREVGVELSHSTLIHSLPLKLCSRVFIGFWLRFDCKNTHSLSLISLLQDCLHTWRNNIRVRVSFSFH